MQKPFPFVFKVGHSVLFVYSNLVYLILVVILYQQLYFTVTTPDSCSWDMWYLSKAEAKTPGRRHTKNMLKLSWKNKRLKWFAHCLRREHNHICAKSLRQEDSGRRSRGRPTKRWWNNVKGDMNKHQLTENMAQDRKHWMIKIMAGPAQGDDQEMWEERKLKLILTCSDLEERKLSERCRVCPSRCRMFLLAWARAFACWICACNNSKLYLDTLFLDKKLCSKGVYRVH